MDAPAALLYGSLLLHIQYFLPVIHSSLTFLFNSLAAGSTLTPVELAALAKVDITTDAPLLDTIETIGDMIDEICRLTDELEEEDK